MKLQQIGSGFILDNFGDPEEIVENSKNPKIHALNETLDTVQGKVIIFAHYKHTINSLEKATGGLVIRGGMSQEQLKEIVYKFNKLDDYPYLVCQLQTTKYGFTFLGTENVPCHTSIYYENSYSLDARIQSEGRNHRIGQHYPVTYIDIIGTDVEKRVIEVLRTKRKLADFIMDIAARSQGVK
jgi:SNF2 family DNA or RNA helicase